MTGGGTAGHVTPNLALIPKLKEHGFEIKYIGSKDGIENEIITKNNIPFFGILNKFQHFKIILFECFHCFRFALHYF